MESIPVEFRTAILGTVVLIAAGFLDYWWHSVFGFEESISALASPPHLLIAIGAVLGAGSIYFATLRKESRELEIPRWASVLSFAYVFMILSFFTQYGNPFAYPLMGGVFKTPDPELGQIIGLSSAIIYSAIFISLLLPLIKRIKLPIGSLLFTLTAAGAGIAIIHEHYYLAYGAFIGGVFAEAYYQFAVRRYAKEKLNILVGIFVPMIIMWAYAIAVLMLWGTWWPIHVAFGSIIIPGIFGYLLVKFKTV